MRNEDLEAAGEAFLRHLIVAARDYIARASRARQSRRLNRDDSRAARAAGRLFSYPLIKVAETPD
jgi:hypothetical protein